MAEEDVRDGMAAHEQEDERVVRIGGGIGEGRTSGDAGLQGGLGFAAAAGDFAPDGIGHAAAGDLNQPGARVIGHSFTGPLGSSGEERFLDSVLGGGEIAEAAEDGSEHLRARGRGGGARSWDAIRSQEFGRWAAHDGADFDGHVEGGAGGTGRGGDLCRDGVCALRASRRR